MNGLPKKGARIGRLGVLAGVDAILDKREFEYHCFTALSEGFNHHRAVGDFPKRGKLLFGDFPEGIAVVNGRPKMNFIQRKAEAGEVGGMGERPVILRRILSRQRF